jgi:hypothetical protein
VKQPHAQNRALEFALFSRSLPLPRRRHPEAIVRVMFERGAFGLTRPSGASAAYFAFGSRRLCSSGVSPGFFAREDTTRDVYRGLSMGLNIAFSWRVSHDGRSRHRAGDHHLRMGERAAALGHADAAGDWPMEAGTSGGAR